MNPKNNQKQEPIEEQPKTPEIIEEEKPINTEPEPPQHKTPLKIIDVRPVHESFLSGLMALVEDGNGNQTYKTPTFYGTLVTEEEYLPTVLILTPDGILVPPFMISGFKAMVYPGTETPQRETYSTKPEFTGEEQKTPPKILEIPEPLKLIPPEKKNRLDWILSTIFKTKEKQPELKPINKDLKELIKDASSV